MHTVQNLNKHIKKIKKIKMIRVPCIDEYIEEEKTENITLH